MRAAASATTVVAGKQAVPACITARYSMLHRGMLRPQLRTSLSSTPAPIASRKHSRTARGVHTTALAPILFTPQTAAIGGLTLGVATAAKYCLNGRILGISGTVKGIVTGDAQRWRFAFLTGLMGAGVLAASIMPGAFDVLPESYTMVRAAAAGLLTGLGAAMGNGCTSGHGICGNSRLSLRSAAATATFMAAGMAAATLTGSLSGSGLAAAAVTGLGAAAAGMAPYQAASWGTLAQALAVLGGSVITLGGLYVFTSSVLTPAGQQQPQQQQTQQQLLLQSLQQQSQQEQLSLQQSQQQQQHEEEDEDEEEPLRSALDTVSELAAGLVFGLGLAVSGMARPSKVLGFLTLGTFSGPETTFLPLAGWDPSLPFVMGGALLVTLPAFQALLRGGAKPLLGDSFSCPAASKVDLKLLAGAALFGAGWGLGGICPGPGIVAAAATSAPQLNLWLVAMVAGLAAEQSVSSALFGRAKA